MTPTPSARLFLLLQHLVPQRLLTRLAGAFARARLGPLTQLAIRLFVRRYGVVLAEAEHGDPRAYGCFNEFFTRPLRAGARPLDADPQVVSSPCDGAVSEAGPLDGTRLLQVKGVHYGAEELLGDAALAARFAGGSFATLYLSPRDYHRVHMPLDGALERMSYVPGPLFSVNPATVLARPGLFARNERVVCGFRGAAGPFVLVLVGAMIVGGIRTMWAGRVTPRTAEPWRLALEAPVTLRRGEELGRFELGSTVILLHPPGQVTWAPTLLPDAPVRLGAAIGRLSSAAS